MTQNLAIVGPFYPDQSDSDVTWNKVTSGANQTFMLTASDNGTWCTTVDASCINKSMVLDSGNTNYGAYYSWFATTAGTGTISIISGSAPSSICPKGWRMPTAGHTVELRNYYSASAFGNNWTLFPLSFALSGYRRGSTTYPAEDGKYWLNSAIDANGAAYMSLDTSTITTSGGSNRYFGFTVRCLAK